MKNIILIFSLLLFLQPYNNSFIYAQGAYEGSGGWLELDGIDDYTSLLDNASLDIGNGATDDFTIECFFYVPDLTGTGTKYLVYKGGSYYLYLVFSTTTGQDRVNLWIDASPGPFDDFTLSYLTNLAVGWHHVAASYDNEYSDSYDAMQIFLDGIRVSNASNFEISPGIYNSTNSFFAGGVSGGGWYYGKIDEIRISDIVRYGSTYSVPVSDHTVDGNTRALWHFSEGTGSVSFADATVNGNTLTGYNGAESLPVEIVSLNAVYQSPDVQLRWTTLTEANNYGFEVQRKASNSWVAIGFVDGSGTASSPQKYSYADKNISTGVYSYRLKQIDRDGKYKYSNEIEVKASEALLKFALLQNYPNPFNPTTKISYDLPVEGYVTIKIFDMLGNEMKILVDELQGAGEHRIEFQGFNLPSGMYFYSLRSGSFSSTKKMILVK